MRKKALMLFLLMWILSSTSMAQGRLRHTANPNFNKFQQKPFYYGIALGYNSSFFNVKHSRAFAQSQNYDVVESIHGPGFHVGVIGNLKIGQYFDLRSLVNFSISSRTITYRQSNGGFLEKESLQSTFVDIPFLLRFKSAPYSDKRLFVITGFKYIYDASNHANARSQDFHLDISPHDFQVEVGAGIQFFLPYFIFSPEIKFSQGLGNILIYNNDDPRSRLLDRILSRSISITLNFEG